MNSVLFSSNFPPIKLKLASRLTFRVTTLGLSVGFTRVQSESCLPAFVAAIAKSRTADASLEEKEEKEKPSTFLRSRVSSTEGPFCFRSFAGEWHRDIMHKLRHMESEHQAQRTVMAWRRPAHQVASRGILVSNGMIYRAVIIWRKFNFEDKTEKFGVSFLSKCNFPVTLLAVQAWCIVYTIEQCCPLYSLKSISRMNTSAKSNKHPGQHCCTPTGHFVLVMRLV